MRERFERIYANNDWEYGSGEGSLPIHTKGYVTFIERFIARQEVKSVVDLGCGDWQFSRNIDWGMAHYKGFDIVKTVIDDNNHRFSSSNVEFCLSSDNCQEPRLFPTPGAPVIPHFSPNGWLVSAVPLDPPSSCTTLLHRP